jgi:DNA-binding winged helix-turn-helix (wHTH) protein
MKVFIIENSYTVNPERNLVNDVQLEPRIMKLLCLLIEYRGQLLRRDTIVEKIWGGYPGGEDGITQAISSLRKLFNDTDKKIITTIPKSGYVFNGKTEIKDSGPVKSVSQDRYIHKSMIYLVLLGAILVILILIFIKPKVYQTPVPGPATDSATYIQTQRKAPKAR